MQRVIRAYCHPSMIGEYINLYARQGKSWERFKNDVAKDFAPEFIKKNEVQLRQVYEDKACLSSIRRTKFNRVA